MLTRKIEQKFEELKKYIDEKFSQQDGSLKEMCSALIENFTKEVKKEIKKQLDDQNDKIARLESDKAMLQEQVKYLMQQNQTNQENMEELEQYGRRLCLRIDGIPTEKNEKSEDVLEKVKSLCHKAEVDIPDLAFDRAHRIGKTYNEKGTNRTCKSIIVRFTTFRHRTLLYRSKKKMSQNVRIKLDLTKKRYSVLSDANDYVKDVSMIKFCYADVNCRLKIKWSDENKEDTFFKSIDDLKQQTEE